MDESTFLKHQKFYIKHWYPYLKAFTFPSSTIPLTIEEAKAILEFSEKKTGDIPEQSRKVLDTLSKKIETMIRRICPAGCFVRLNSHSPNDAVTSDITHCIDAFKIKMFESVYDPYSVDEVLDNDGNLLKIEDEKQVTPDYYQQQNDLLKGTRKGINSALKIKNGNEALQLFYHSDKVLNDLEIALKYKKYWKVEIIVREFNEHVQLENEYRGFVYDNQLTALSQYDIKCYYPSVTEKASETAKKIKDFWENSIKNFLQEFKSYVIDFVVLPNNEIKVVEIDPFYHFAGGCLYSWHKDEKVMKSGPFEIRVIRQPVKQINLLKSYETMIKKALVRARKQRDKDKTLFFVLLVVLVGVLVILYIMFQLFVEGFTPKFNHDEL
eukprot:gene11521-4685_t